MAALRAIEPAVEVHGIVAAAENMPDGTAYRPGDVFGSLDGKTVEIVNTDAEGRLVLADALTYAARLEPDLIVDAATLTGACMVALGDRIAGLMSNDGQLEQRIRDAAEAAGERVWPLPLPEDYAELLESDIADVKNIGTRYGGALTAGLFLSRFVEDGIPWAHLDIAGPGMTSPVDGVKTKGGTGFGVRTLCRMLRNWGTD